MGGEKVGGETVGGVRVGGERVGGERVGGVCGGASAIDGLHVWGLTCAATKR